MFLCFLGVACCGFVVIVWYYGFWVVWLYLVVGFGVVWVVVGVSWAWWIGVSRFAVLCGAYGWWVCWVFCVCLGFANLLAFGGCYNIGLGCGWLMVVMCGLSL